MEIKKIISKSKDGSRAEVIIENDNKTLMTKHIHGQSDDSWNYCSGWTFNSDKERVPVLKKLSCKVF